MKKNTLSFKIISRILLFSMILGGIIFSIYYYYSRSSIESMTRANAIFLAENTVNKIEEVIKPAEKIPENLAWIIESGSISKDSITSFLMRIVKNNPSIYASAIAFEPYTFSTNEKFYAPYAFRNGDQIETTILGADDYNYFIMDWYQIPATLKEPYWTEPYYDEGGAGALLSTYSVPFYVRKAGQRVFGGVITIDISLEWLTDIVNSVKIFETGYAFLLSRNGVYVTHPNRAQIMNETIFTRAKELNEPKMREIGRDMIQGNSNLSSITLKDKGFVWIYYTRLSSTKWSLAVVYPHREMFARLHQLNLVILLLSLIGLGLLLFFTIKIIDKLISPLTKFAHSARTIAEGNFNAALPKIENNAEMMELHDSFQFMQKELSNYIIHLKETTSAKEKIESELRIAKEIQMGMIPHIFPPFPDMTQIDLFALLEPAKEVGGDLYDFFLIDDTHLCFAIGDVSGKGVPASLFMAVTRTLLRSMAPKQRSPKIIIDALNNSLTLGNESSMFVTFFLAIINIETGEMKYSNAGHNPPAIIHENGEVEFFEITKEIPLGLFDDFEYTERERIITKNERLFLYTDGITEAENWNEELYTEKKLMECLSTVDSLDPSEIVMKVARDVVVHVNDYQQSDDLTMLCLIYYGNKNYGRDN